MYRSLRLAGFVTAVTASWVLTSTPPRMADAQTVRGSRTSTATSSAGGSARTTTTRTETVSGNEGYAAVGRSGSTVVTGSGAAATQRHGAVVATEEGYAAAGCRSAVAVGEHGGAAGGRQCGSVAVGNHYDDYEAWHAAAGVGAVIVVGTMLARPPAAAVTVSVGGSSYWYNDNVFYTRVMTGGTVAYQVVGPPAGAIITTLPASCTAVRVGGVAYSRCGSTYYQRMSTGYRVVVL